LNIGTGGLPTSDFPSKENAWNMFYVRIF
jgi:hypothetical protein